MATVAELEAKKKALEAKIAKAKQQERKNEDRKKILLGVVFMGMRNAGIITNDQAREYIDRFITNERDRQLFKLKPPTPEPTPEPEQLRMKF